MKLAGGGGYRETAKGVYAIEAGPAVALDAVGAVIFDVDGVLVEVSESFRQVISLTVQHYFNEALGVPGDDRLVTAEQSGLFKLAGRFNNDWDLTRGAVACCLVKLHAAGGDAESTAGLRNRPPSLEEFTREVRRRGGGLEAALELARERLDGEAAARFDRDYRPELIKRIFMEYYGGPELCRDLYGFEPEHYRGPGMIEREKFLLDLGLARRLADSGVKLGVLSGRTPEEADYLFRANGLDVLLEPEFVITDDGGLPGKPDPAGLAELARRMEFSAGLYVGDVPDDWTTVARYRTERGGLPPVAGCLVGTGSTSDDLMQEFVAGQPVDYLSDDVNHLLRALIGRRRGE